MEICYGLHEAFNHFLPDFWPWKNLYSGVPYRNLISSFKKFITADAKIEIIEK